jgi:hypothetical protein
MGLLYLYLYLYRHDIFFEGWEKLRKHTVRKAGVPEGISAYKIRYAQSNSNLLGYEATTLGSQIQTFQGNV